MGKARKAIDGRDQHIRTLQFVLGVAVLIIIAMWWGWKSAPSRINVDIPPDLRTGSTRKIGERHPFNVYAFGYYIFQQVNNWPRKGSDDYMERINSMSCYFTPNFKKMLLDDYEKKKMKHELNRKRAIQEIPGRGYSQKRVFVESPDSWVAYYDISLRETYRGSSIKEAMIRYPVRIVRWDVDPECNLWGLALDSFYETPRRLIKTNAEANDLASTDSAQ